MLGRLNGAGFSILAALSRMLNKACSPRPLPLRLSMGNDRNSDGSEMEEISDGLNLEEISDDFFCCVCLELLYKPIVLGCGHISCFWCVHKSMNSWNESCCPVCRHSYYHFPTICPMLHLLLLKMYPVSYEKRRHQILENEKEMEAFSPQFDVNPCASWANHLVNQLTSSMEIFPSDSYSTSCCTENESSVNLVQSESVPRCQDYGVSTENDVNKIDSQILISDVLCAVCKELLFGPVVLNCGHVFCEACITFPAAGLLRCPACQCPDPRGVPKVCLILNHFLEKQFPKQYSLRKESSVKQGSMNGGVQGAGSDSLAGGKHIPAVIENQLDVHIGVGCDSCGLFPIVGERYRCRDCSEKIGFDLCGDCYNSQSKLPGRFNQRHTPDHRFTRMKFEYPFSRQLGLENGSAHVGVAAGLLLSHLVEVSEDSDGDEVTSGNTSGHGDEVTSGNTSGHGGAAFDDC